MPPVPDSSRAAGFIRGYSRSHTPEKITTAKAGRDPLSSLMRVGDHRSIHKNRSCNVSHIVASPHGTEKRQTGAECCCMSSWHVDGRLENSGIKSGELQAASRRWVNTSRGYKRGLLPLLSFSTGKPGKGIHSFARSGQ